MISSKLIHRWSDEFRYIVVRHSDLLLIIDSDLVRKYDRKNHPSNRNLKKLMKYSVIAYYINFPDNISATYIRSIKSYCIDTLYDTTYGYGVVYKTHLFRDISGDDLDSIILWCEMNNYSLHTMTSKDIKVRLNSVWTPLK